MNSRSDWFASAQVLKLPLRFGQCCRLHVSRQMPPGTSMPAAKEFSRQRNVGFLKFAIVAEFILIRLGHDQPMVCLAQHAFLLQPIGPPPHRFDGEP
jgi:hypothetical protein